MAAQDDKGLQLIGDLLPKLIKPHHPFLANQGARE